MKSIICVTLKNGLIETTHKLSYNRHLSPDEFHEEADKFENDLTTLNPSCEIVDTVYYDK